MFILVKVSLSSHCLFLRLGVKFSNLLPSATDKGNVPSMTFEISNTKRVKNKSSNNKIGTMW